MCGKIGIGLDSQGVVQRRELISVREQAIQQPDSCVVGSTNDRGYPLRILQKDDTHIPVRFLPRHTPTQLTANQHNVR